jgi:nucleotide-binding universal stress UspA family protein
MSGIVCAIRGGLDCRSTVAQAIALAQKTGLPLRFLYVVNHNFLSYGSDSQAHTVSEKMHHMGEAVLLAARTKADALDIPAETVVREGKVGGEIVDLCQDLSADYVVLGYPRTEREGNTFTKNTLSSLSGRIERECGVKVVLAENNC